MDANTFPAGLRVLAVDDDRVCLKILERQLKYCNYNATVVTDAMKALDMLRERKDGNQFDLVISDVVMPNMDGFKLLELVGLEMDLPVIMLSANSETQNIIKGIKHGACDYLVKPVRLEQLRGIWIHVVKNNKIDPWNNISSDSDSDDVVQNLPSMDSDKGEKVGENLKTYPKKNEKVVDVASEDNENTSAQKKQRVHWYGQLHQKFVEAVGQIGVDRAAPKKILEIMNVEGLTRENVSSHLQKYRIYLKKLSDGAPRKSNSFADETGPLRRTMSVVPSFISSLSSGPCFAKMNSSYAIGTQTLLSTKSVHVMSSEKNLGIPQSNMDIVGHGFNMPKDAMIMPTQDISRLVASSKPYAPVSSGELLGASQCFPSSHSGSSFGNISNGVVLNARKPSFVDVRGNSFANSSNDSAPLTLNMCFSASHSCSSYAGILRETILGSSKGIPFEDIENGEMLAPSNHLPLKTPELVNQPSVQLQFNRVIREVCQFAGPINSGKAIVPSRFFDLGHNVGTSEYPSQDNLFKINQLSRLAHSYGEIPTSGNEYQKKISGIMGETIPVVGSKEQMAPFSFGNDTHSKLMPIGNSALASSSSTRVDLQIDNSAMSTLSLNGGGVSDNLYEGSTISQQAIIDQVNKINEFLMGTSEAHNVESDDLDAFLAYLDNQDFVNGGDSFINGDSKFAP